MTSACRYKGWKGNQMKGMSRTVITSIVREERHIAYIDSKHMYCRYKHSKTTITTTSENKPKVIRRKKTA